MNAEAHEQKIPDLAEMHIHTLTCRGILVLNKTGLAAKYSPHTVHNHTVQIRSLDIHGRHAHLRPGVRAPRISGVSMLGTPPLLPAKCSWKLRCKVTLV
jgi:hypothetical protein